MTAEENNIISCFSVSRLLGSHSSLTEASYACKAEVLDGTPGTLLLPSDVAESAEALADTANVWRMQVDTKLRVTTISYRIELC